MQNLYPQVGLPIEFRLRMTTFNNAGYAYQVTSTVTYQPEKYPFTDALAETFKTLNAEGFRDIVIINHTYIFDREEVA